MNDQTFPDPIPGILLYRTVNIFAGAPGVGKTAMIMDWIARMATGRTVWGHPTTCPTGFYYLAGDRQWDSHARWLELAGIPEGLVHHYSITDDPLLDLNHLKNTYDALDLFALCLEKLDPQPGSLLIVDPGSPLFIAGSANNSKDVARSLITMSRIIRAKQITILMAAHFGKQSADLTTRYTRPQDRIAGSTAFSGFSDSQFYLVDPEPQNNQPWHLLGWVPRHTRPQEFKCTRGDNGLFIPYNDIEEDVTAQQILDQFVATGSTTYAVIVDRAFELHQLSKATVKRAITRLLEDRRIVRLGRGLYGKINVH